LYALPGMPLFLMGRLYVHGFEKSKQTRHGSPGIGFCLHFVLREWQKSHALVMRVCFLALVVSSAGGGGGG
jgi:hypothetical protein